MWSGNPNAVVASEVETLPPGRALDVGCGEGGDALWLAQRGWHVDGVDISQVALDRARGHAERAGVSDLTTWQQVDVYTWRPAEATYDLVSVPFLHLPSADRPAVYAALAAAVAVGGTFLVVAHSPLDHGTTMSRPHHPDLYFTEDELAAELGEGWDVVTCEARSRPGVDPEGRPVDAARHRAARRAPLSPGDARASGAPWSCSRSAQI